MRFAVVAMVVLVVSVGSSALAQKPSGPPTLENLLNGDNPGATAKAEESPAAEDEDKSVPPTGTYVRPKDGSKDPDLEKAWATYDAAVEKATTALRDAIGKQRAAAREVADLDAAKRYRDMLEALEKKGQLPADDKVLQKQVKSAQDAYKVAAGELEQAYKAVVVKLVKDTTLDESIAEAVQREAKAIGSAEKPPARREAKAIGAAEKTPARLDDENLNQLCEIDVTASERVAVEELRQGVERLTGQRGLVFEKVKPHLDGAVFLRVVWNSKPSYRVSVKKSGVLYMIAPEAKIDCQPLRKWEVADTDLSGSWINAKYRLAVKKGDTFVCSGLELALIAAKITLR